MKSIVYAFIILTAITSFKPIGVVTSVLTCKSKSGSVTFTANLTDYEVFGNSELLIDKSKLSFTSKDKGYAIFDSKNKVFTLYLESGNNIKVKGRTAFLQFWVIPSSFKSQPIDKTKDEYTIHDLYQFKAKIISSDPRPGKETETPILEMDGTLEVTL